MSAKIGLYERVFIFVIIVLGITVGIIRSGGNIPFLSRDKEFKVIAKKGYGLKPGSIIKMQDLEIGKVQEVFLNEKNKVVIIFRVKKEFKDKIKKDSVATIALPPLLGSSEIHISCGSPLARDVPEGSIITLKEPEGDLISGLQERINPALEKMNSTLDNLIVITDEIRRGRGTLGRIFMEDALYQEILTLVKNSNILFENMQKISDNIAKSSERFPQIVGSADKSLDNVKEITQSTKSIVDKIEKGEGTVGKLLTDESVHKKTKEIMTSTSNILKKVENVNIAGGMDTGYYGKQDVLVSKIYTKISASKDHSLKIGGAFIGYKDEGVKSRPELLFTKEISDKNISLKAGLLEGEVGVGVDYLLKDKKTSISLEGRKTADKNVYDREMDDFILRGWLGVKIKNYLQLKVGVNNLTSSPGASLGVIVGEK